MKELELKYGCNPNQKPARIFMADGGELPVEVMNGRPGYINFMDALNSWQLVRALKRATGKPAAASFKHVSPAGAAIASPLSDEDRRVFFAEGDLSPIAAAHARARGGRHSRPRRTGRGRPGCPGRGRPGRRRGPGGGAICL